VWELPDDEIAKIETTQKALKAEARQMAALTPNATKSHRPSVIMREKQLDDIRRERDLLNAEKLELERLRKEVLGLKKPVRVTGVSFEADTRSPASSGPIRAPTSNPPANRRTSTILGALVASTGNSSPTPNSVTGDNSRGPRKTRKSVVEAPTFTTKQREQAGTTRAHLESNESSVSTGSRSRSASAAKHQKNRSKEAKKLAGPTLAKAFFPEKQNCTCCSGYIYGCDETVCHQLGKCICSLEEGESTGEVKKKKGKYEYLHIKEKGTFSMFKKSKELAMEIGDRDRSATLLSDGSVQPVHQKPLLKRIQYNIKVSPLAERSALFEASLENTLFVRRFYCSPQTTQSALLKATAEIVLLPPPPLFTLVYALLFNTSSPVQHFKMRRLLMFLLTQLLKYPYIMYLHLHRAWRGSFQDLQLSSSSERVYLGKRFDIDPDGKQHRHASFPWAR